MMSDQVNFAEKISKYRKILTQDRKSLVFIPLAGCFLKTGQLDDALETALKGTWELPDYAPGYVAVARIYARRQGYQKAITNFQKALEIDPARLDAYKGLARIHHEQGDLVAVSTLLTKAVSLFPNEPSLKQMLDSLTSVAPEPVAEAVTAATTQGTSGMEPITTATIAEIYIKQGLYDKALDVYRELFTETQDPAVARKITEIEKIAQDNTPHIAPEMSVPEHAIPPVTDQPSTTVESKRVSEKSVLEYLNRLLISIQARRNRV